MTRDAKSLEGRIEAAEKACSTIRDYARREVVALMHEQQSIIRELLFRNEELEGKLGDCQQTLGNIREVWAGADIGKPVYAQEAYAISLLKQCYQEAVDTLSRLSEKPKGELRERLEHERQINDSLMQTNKAMGGRLKELEGKLGDATVALKAARSFLVGASAELTDSFLEREDVDYYNDTLKIINTCLSRLSEKPKGE